MLFRLEDRLCNVALVAVRPELSRSEAADQLVRLGKGVDDVLSAYRILRSLPKQVKVAAHQLDEFKRFFETQEYFHHQRFLGTGLLSREVWVTLRDLDSSPDYYFKWISDLIFRPPWNSILREAQIVLRNGVVITLDRRPS